jgi:methylated-DNA-[protein]-cysteine S-methyltransferase
MTIEATTMTTPVGELSLLARNDVLIAAGFAPIDELAGRVGSADPRPGADEPVVRRRDLGRITDALTSYFAGDVAAIDDLPVDQPEGEFFRAARKVMREIPAGETITYAELAERAGNPKAVRAAGSACARNLVAPIVPCHRVVRSGAQSSLGGYYYGLSTKEWLLEHERQSTGRS